MGAHRKTLPMWNPFKKKPKPMTTMERAQLACDIVNDIIPELPRNVSFWMDWNARPPQLVLQERQPGKRVYPDR